MIVRRDHKTLQNIARRAASRWGDEGSLHGYIALQTGRSKSARCSLKNSVKTGKGVMANPDPSPSTRFQPAVSGNPRGRPKGLSIAGVIRAMLVHAQAVDDGDRVL